MKVHFFGIILISFASCSPKQPQAQSPIQNQKTNSTLMNKIEKTEQEWKSELTASEFEIARKKGTERAFTGALLNNHEPGTYHCVCCGETLFLSDSKFESGSGWPSFFAAANDSTVAETTDNTHGMARVEITCARCDAHLGHVFDDGPNPTGLRYCVNSASLKFKHK